MERMPIQGEQVGVYRLDGQKVFGKVTKVHSETCINVEYKDEEGETVEAFSVLKGNPDVTKVTWDF